MTKFSKVFALVSALAIPVGVLATSTTAHADTAGEEKREARLAAAAEMNLHRISIEAEELLQVGHRLAHQAHETRTLAHRQDRQALHAWIEVAHIQNLPAKDVEAYILRFKGRNAKMEAGWIEESIKRLQLHEKHERLQIEHMKVRIARDVAQLPKADKEHKARLEVAIKHLQMHIATTEKHLQEQNKRLTHMQAHHKLLVAAYEKDFAEADKLSPPRHVVQTGAVKS